MKCPICGMTSLRTCATRQRVEEEFAIRERFFADRIDGHIEPAEMKDRTDVVYRTAAEIRVCPACGILVRAGGDGDFTSDPYAPYVMEKILRSHIDAYRHKAQTYRPLLAAGARVLEVGSYVGAFLHVASEWEWDAIGVDVGEDTAHFAAAHGYPTRKVSLEEAAFDDASFDGVFVWNCFEQLEPRPLLREIRRVLRDAGILVIRTPNARFYTSDPPPIVLAHTNLLGFPHRYGYTIAALDRLLIEEGFEPLDHRGDMHILPTHSRLTATARREEDEVSAAIATCSDPNGWPWIECVYRRYLSS
jgi:SAM-dependent methyltransferase